MKTNPLKTPIDHNQSFELRDEVLFSRAGGSQQKVLLATALLLMTQAIYLGLDCEIRGLDQTLLAAINPTTISAHPVVLGAYNDMNASFLGILRHQEGALLEKYKTHLAKETAAAFEEGRTSGASTAVAVTAGS